MDAVEQPPIDLRWGAVSDVGQVRQVNEDSWVADPPVFAVADGMGGHAGGDVASGIVAEELATLAGGWLDVESGVAAVADALGRCQARILEYAEEQRVGGAAQWYAGTTVVVALLVRTDGDPSWLIVNLGDSRAYRAAGDLVEQVTVDHSLVQQLFDAGVITEAELAVHPERHVITRALGGPDDIHPELFLVPVSAAPRLLMCSDGVTNMLSSERLAELLSAEPDAERAARELVAAAVAAGGHDNATAVVVDVVGWAP